MSGGVHKYSPGDQIDPSNRLVIYGAHIRAAQGSYPEAVSVALMHPDWEGRWFIIEPASAAYTGLLEILSEIDRESAAIPTKAYSFYDTSGKKAKLIAVVVHQQGYKAYDSLYTYRLY